MPASAWRVIASGSRAARSGMMPCVDEPIEIGAKRGAAIAGERGAHPAGGRRVQRAIEIPGAPRRRRQPVRGGRDRRVLRELRSMRATMRA